MERERESEKEKWGKFVICCCYYKWWDYTAESIESKWAFKFDLQSKKNLNYRTIREKKLSKITHSRNHRVQSAFLNNLIDQKTIWKIEIEIDIENEISQIY